MLGSTRLASWAMAFPLVLPKVDQPEISGRLVGSLEVDDQVIALDRDRHMDVQVLMALWVTVHVDVRHVGAVGPAGDLPREPTVCVGDGVLDGGLDGSGP